jgi:hypothetical protein
MTGIATEYSGATWPRRTAVLIPRVLLGQHPGATDSSGSVASQATLLTRGYPLSPSPRAAAN